ncbi:MAG: hypothetical protein OXU77_08850 [Gammaproteobacteria bacterium]|nr:hypothetical protein [Gammaproteobacteria bacterium]MDE0441562.1 hypothetical protein [Gammaproteobacteria bacterium]
MAAYSTGVAETLPSPPVDDTAVVPNADRVLMEWLAVTTRDRIRATLHAGQWLRGAPLALGRQTDDHRLEHFDLEGGSRMNVPFLAPHQRTLDYDDIMAIMAAATAAITRAAHIIEQELSGTKARPSNVYESEYADRFRELREAASEDGYALREESASSFIEFLHAAPYDVKRAGLALAGGGDVNAIWVSEDRTRRVSIQVFGDGDVEYVMLWPNSAPEMDRVSPEVFWSEFSSRLRDFLAA